MKQEEKDLLLKDLCGRLQYNLHCRVFKLNGEIKENDDILYGIIGDNVVTLKSDKDECLMYYQIKPYLRSMSSMTKEEKAYKEFYFKWDDYTDWDYVDWLNKKGFDYRGLIPMGLALEDPEIKESDDGRIRKDLINYFGEHKLLEHKCAIEAVKRLYYQKLIWSEEDEMKSQFVLAMCDDIKRDSATYSTKYREIEEVKIWLKSLRDRMKGE